MTPKLNWVASLATGPNCVAYAVHQPGQASDAFIAKLAPDGSILWTTYLGGSDRDTAVALAVDAQGNAYMAGNTFSPDFPRPSLASASKAVAPCLLPNTRPMARLHTPR